ncbi:hypothetical protein CYMTET_23783 [Cymbomonas tetramitiformis]|uniref:Thioesterase n=1 Tax=Cymbomonas tetramitiformis TaxID=36881 RepID=A0AAE0L0R8_9CHLO|nr:hypothetical protein CYMTET_23783 [Cymbomonas tetramitiformis]
MAEETYIHHAKLEEDLKNGIQQTLRGVSGAMGESQITCPITTYIGTQDEHVSERGLQGWHALGHGACTIHRLPGDHFFLEDTKSREQLLRSISHVLVQRLSRHGNWITMGNGDPLTRDRSR